MKITDIDEGRLKYIWSDTTERHYQVLQQLDNLEWRVYSSSNPEAKPNYVSCCGGSFYYLTYIDGVPMSYESMTTIFFFTGQRSM